MTPGGDGIGSAVLAIRAGVPVASLEARLRDRMASLAAAPAVSRAVVSIADVDPGTARWVRPGEREEAPAYDAVVELSARADGFDDVVSAAIAVLSPEVAVVHAWRVTRLPARTEPAPPTPGTRSPGTKYIVLCTFHPDLPDNAARRSWDHHVPLALRVHQGAARYVRSWIDAPLTADAPRFQGITELCFPTREDMEQRWFVGDRARAEIVQDIGHFLHSGVRLYTSEYVLKDDR